MTTPAASRSRFRVSRLAVGASGVAAGLTLLLTPLGASGQVTADEAPAASVITVTQTPSGVTGDCVPAELAPINGSLQVYPYSTMDFFQLTVIATAPLCTPIEAKAAVYAMPSDGSQWPQTFVETKTIIIQEAGTTVVTFAKGCDRVQYDLVTGATPPVLNNGFDHTLLFPGNLDTAFQHVGNGPNCVAASTTVAPTTAPATTIPSKVLEETTVAPTTIPAAVLAATTGPRSGVSDSGLAVTGTATSGPMALMGGGLVLVGLAFMLASRRRLA